MKAQIKLKDLSSVRDITTGGMMIALFAISSNVIPPIYLVPNVPITLQNMVIVMIGALLGIKNGLFCILALLAGTFCGLPFMANFKGGPSVFLSPTGGFIFGFIIIVLLMGIYRDIILPMLIKSKWRKSIHFLTYIFVGFVAILVQYACGAIGLSLFSGKDIMSFPNIFLKVLYFLPVDILKVIIAAVLTFPLYITIFKSEINKSI